MGEVRSPDGRTWTVRVERLILPRFRESRYDPSDEDHLVLLSYLAAPIFWFVLPLLLAIVQLPVAVVRAVFSSRRDVVASCSWPGELQLRFRTDAAHAR